MSNPKKIWDIPMFSKEKGAFLHFLLVYGIIVCFSLIYPLIKYGLTWMDVVTGLCLLLFLILIYGISSFLAYRTKMFPKLSSRENLHARCFLILSLLSFAIIVLVIIIKTQF